VKITVAVLACVGLLGGAVYLSPEPERTFKIGAPLFAIVIGVGVAASWLSQRFGSKGDQAEE
jgi:hypothetical protein